VFRHPLRGIFLLVSAACLGVASPAHAVADVVDVGLTITIARTTLGSDSFEVELRVEGTDLNQGTIALPSAPGSQIPLTSDSGDLVWTENFSTETALNAALTNGSYVLRVNNGTAQASIVYTRPGVPTPGISQPAAGSVQPPGPVEVRFASCPICNQIADSVKARLEDDAMMLLDEETLTAGSTSWVPQDIAGDLELPPQSAFVARVTHTALRQGSVDVTGADDDGTLLFTGTVIQSDEVDFETGFAAPEGHFCLSANHPTPPPGCETVTDPLLQIFDLTGVVTMTQVDGHDVVYTVSVGAGGELTGSALADLDDNASNETGPAPIKGKLGGSGGEVGSKLSFSLENAGLLAKLKLSVTDALSIQGDMRDRLQRASGAINGVKIKEDVSSSDAPLPNAPLGWVLEYDLDAAGLVQNAVLTLEGGRSFTLTGSNKFNFAANQSGLKLQSNPKGVSVTLKKLGLDDSSDPMDITEGDVSYRALGQSGRVTIP